MTLSKELLFSVTRDDCEWSYYRSSGAGGQHKNKTDSAVRCFHRPSGAIAQAAESRSQLDNRRLAFERMANTPEFKHWLKIETARRTRDAREEERLINAAVDRQLRPANLRVEVAYNGEWVPEDSAVLNPINIV